MRQQKKRMKRSNKENKFKNWISVSLKAIPVFVSVLSLVFSFLAFNISKMGYELNLEPILKVNLNTKSNKKTYLKLHNDGSKSIYDIKVKILLRVLDVETHAVPAATNAQNESFSVKELKPNEVKELEVNDSEIERASALKYQMEALQRKSVHLVSAILFDVSFRRLPDRKMYNLQKYLFLVGTGSPDELFRLDPDADPLAFHFKYAKEALDGYEAILRK
jgi:hypothetical protein